MSDTTDAGVKADGKDTTRKGPKGRVWITQDRCKGCGMCIEFCPLGVLRMSANFNAKGYHYPEPGEPDKCTGCGLCGMYCPDFAIFGLRFPKPGEDAKVKE